MSRARGGGQRCGPDQGRRGSSMSRARERRGVHNVAGLRRMMLLWAQERYRGLGDEAHAVDGGTDSGWGRWQFVRALTVVGNDDAEAPRRT
jgi:hypothetical protein